MKQLFTNRWYHTSKPNPLWLPFSYGYRGVMALRHCLYRWRIKKTTYFDVPVIVVGNLTVGGTGKTPLVSWLAQWCQQQGWRVGLVSRGYGGRSKAWPVIVKADSNPVLVGDEAVMLVQQTGCPMAVGPDRVVAVAALLAKQPCDVIISDDGLQHLALGRQLEIAVIDGERGFGNGYCLPAGPLRESLARLDQVDLQVCTQSKFNDAYLMTLRSGVITSVMDPKQTIAIPALAAQRVHAIAGIGHPQRFFRQLEFQGLQFEPHVFADHHNFSASDIEFGNDAIVVMTEKDAVKCRAFADQRHWYLPIQAVLPEAFIMQLSSKLASLGLKRPAFANSEVA